MEKNLKNNLIFEADGKSARICFASGKESFSFESKKEAIYGIIDCHKRKKISEDEMISFLTKIFFAENLRLDDCSSGKVFGKIIAIEISGAIKGLCFKVCGCKEGILHGYFKNETGEIFSPPIAYQIQGRKTTEMFFELGIIDEKTRDSLNMMMELAKLPFKPINPTEN